MLAGGLRPLPGRLVTDSRSALGARRARPHATPFAQQHLKFHGPPNSGRSVAEWAPSLKKATGASRPSLQQRLPGAEGPPEGCTTAPRHAACGGPLPSSAEGPHVIPKFERSSRTFVRFRSSRLPQPARSVQSRGSGWAPPAAFVRVRSSRNPRERQRLEGGALLFFFLH